MNNQQIFSKVYHHLITQKCRSTCHTFECAYRGENGTKCAVGCLVKDQYYSPGIEGQAIPSVPKSYGISTALVNSGIPKESFPLLRRLQIVHDREIMSAPVGDWHCHLAQVAEEFGLETP